MDGCVQLWQKTRRDEKEGRQGDKKETSVESVMPAAVVAANVDVFRDAAAIVAAASSCSKHRNWVSHVISSLVSSEWLH